MLLEIPHLLSKKKLTEVQKLLHDARFVDGKLSAGMYAQRVKHNEELPADAAQLQHLNNLVMNTLVQHPEFQSAVLPHRVASPFYARYGKGQSYGDHIDDPIMGPMGQRYRSDVSCTIFLSEPSDYGGGELVIRTTFGDQSVKLAAGHAVIYPSSSLHHVNAVMDGERLVAVTWIQSLVRDAARRELLYELNLAREKLMRDNPDAAETKQVDHTYVNLVRMWSEV
jgi:PKHD-type hydroxylase